MKENPYFKEKLLQISGLPVQGMKIKLRRDRHSLQNKSGVPARICCKRISPKAPQNSHAHHSQGSTHTLSLTGVLMKYLG